MPLKFDCINCGQEIIARYLKIGDAVKCRHCGAEMAVPENAIASDEKSTLLGVKVPDSSIADSQAKPGTDAKVQTKDQNYPNIAQAVWLMILVLLLDILLSILMHIISSQLYQQTWCKLLATYITIGLLLKYGINRTGLSLAEIFPFKRFSIPVLISMSISIIGIQIVTSEIDNLIRLIIPMPEYIAKISHNLVTNHSWSVILGLVVVGPWAEEFLFRGLILRGFLKHYTVKKSIFISALLFGLFHFNPWQFVGAFIGGILLAWLYVKMKSLWLCFIGHSLMNALAVIATFIEARVPDFLGEPTKVTGFLLFWLDLLGLFLAVFGIWLLNRIFIKQGNHVAETNTAAL